MIRTRKSHAYRFDSCPERPKIACAECGEYVELLTHTHLRLHPPHLIQAQEEYCRNHPEHSYMHFWPDAPQNRAKTKYKQWRLGK